VPAFDKFFAAESDTLYRRMRLVTRDHHEAEEVIQDAFLEMYERWDRISARRPRGHAEAALEAFWTTATADSLRSTKAG